MDNKDKKSLGYRLGEILGTVIVGSVIVLITAFTLNVVMWLF